MTHGGWQAMSGLFKRAAFIVAGILLGFGVVAGHGFWQARPHLDAPPPRPSPASAPSGAYVAPGSQG